MANSDTDCSICLQRYVHPVELPCGHIFCFVCIKGCALHRRRCPMCRARFSMRFIDDPKLVNISTLEAKTNSGASTSGNFILPEGSQTTLIVQPNKPDNEYRWFYEGFAGWWQYDERTSEELESAFARNMSSYDVQVAGFIYTIDFVHMTQKRKDNSGRKRRIKRDLKCCPKKGIAGIKLSHIEPNFTAANNNCNEPSANITDYPDSPTNHPVPSSTSCDVPHCVESSNNACNLSETSSYPRIVCTGSSVTSIPPDPVMTCVPSVNRSHSTSRGHRTLSLIRSSPPRVMELRSGSLTNRTNGSNRQSGLRVSRSVPRQ